MAPFHCKSLSVRGDGLLAEEPGLSNAQLARRSFVMPQTMNRILAMLGASGLVEPRAHAEHGRVLRSYLIEEGEQHSW